MVDVRITIGNGPKSAESSPGTVNMEDDDACLLDNSTESKKAEVAGAKKKETKLEITLSEAERLITYLNDASTLLSQGVDELQYMEIRNVPVIQSRHCLRLKKLFSKFMGKVSGAVGISATVILQLLCLIMLTLVDSLPKDEGGKHRALEFGSTAMLILQTANLLIVILISVRLLNQIQKREVTRILLAQSYIATVLLFSGIYTASYRLEPKSWKFVSDHSDDESDPVMILDMYAKFFFFSVSTATLCGAADALPNEWYTSLVASGQMLLSFMYFTSVLGTTLSKRRRPAPRQAFHIKY